jgi:UDPglucose 6-dehydrogenase
MIYVIGLGFVGLTTLLGFSKKNFDILGVENNKVRFNLYKKKRIPFKEPFLSDILKKQKKIIIEKNLRGKLKKNNFFFICVGTPTNKDESQNLNQIHSAIKDIIKFIGSFRKSNNFIIIKSTILPGTIEKLEKIYKKYNLKFISNPEFLREGHAWEDLINGGRIIIGSNDHNISLKVKKLYVKFNGEIILTNSVTAEFSKYLSNTALSTMISFSNEITMIAEKFNNIDVKKMFLSFKKDKRWFNNTMSNYFHPGIGYGGYCLPKDTIALSKLSKKIGYKDKILSSTIEINKKIFNHQVNKIKKINKNKKIVVLGITFKALSDDLRNSIPIRIINKLRKIGYKNIFIHDPLVKKFDKKYISEDIKFVPKLKKEKKNFYILMNQWPIYKKFLKKIDKNKIIDLRYEI